MTSSWINTTRHFRVEQPNEPNGISYARRLEIKRNTCHPIIFEQRMEGTISLITPEGRSCKNHLQNTTWETGVCPSWKNTPQKNTKEPWPKEDMDTDRVVLNQLVLRYKSIPLAWTSKKRFPQTNPESWTNRIFFVGSFTRIFSRTKMEIQLSTPQLGQGGPLLKGVLIPFATGRGPLAHLGG